MSVHPGKTPDCVSHDGAVELVIETRERDIGGFSVRRVLPAARQRMVGPFIFFDHIGPADFPPGQGIQVRPHPHIGIATITYLFEGMIMHRDSLGYALPITPGAVNLMTAGRGIVHSERAGDDLDRSAVLHAIQSWIVLPADQQECDPEFQHFPAESIPGTSVGNVDVRVIIGEAWGLKSPVPCRSSTLYAELHLPGGAALALPTAYQQRAVYAVQGSVQIAGTTLQPRSMAVLEPGRELVVEAITDSRLMLIGGEPLGKRHIWWNFVSADPARIEQAKQDWLAGRFALVPGDDEFIPLPE
jgi:redox-sensitive bicupin YhaK (pirin superfamily)